MDFEKRKWLPKVESNIAKLWVPEQPKLFCVSKCSPLDVP